MKKVSIWDLDYYYANDRTNLFNPDAQRISSYHKQKGDSINFISAEEDVNRPCDIMYIIKEQTKTPNPPLKWLVDPRVRWWGEAYKSKANWKMTDTIWSCYPDYQLYPNKNTAIERGEQLKFFNNEGNLLHFKQSSENIYTNKKIIIADKYIWNANKNEDILIVLDQLKDVKNLYFLYPINLNRILGDERLKTAFLALHLSPGANLQWEEIKTDKAIDAINFAAQLRQNPNCNAKINTLIISYSKLPEAHWKSNEAARADFETLKRIIIYSKKKRVQIQIEGPAYSAETPYWHLMTLLDKWTHNQHKYKLSWLEFITSSFVGFMLPQQIEYWYHIERWNDNYRNIIRQTYQDREFLLTQWGDAKVNEVNIPWKLWDEEFVNGI